MNAQPSIKDRRFARYPTDGSPVMVATANLTFEAIAVDESIGGLGIESSEPVEVVAGEAARLTYRGCEYKGQILASKTTPNGGCRISIGWEEKEVRPDDEKLLTFFEFASVTVVCEAAGNDTASTSIKLWDGKDFEVRADQLTSRTRQSRWVELQSMGDQRDLIARLYGLDTSGRPEMVSSRILEFEFGGDGDR